MHAHTKEITELWGESRPMMLEGIRHNWLNTSNEVYVRLRIVYPATKADGNPFIPVTFAGDV